MLQTVRAETAAEQLRANDLAGTVTAFLAAGEDSSQAEQQLLGVLDGLAVFRMREHAIEVMSGLAPATAET